ncbi:MAG: hypothetical protein ACI86C_001259 [Candidatus Latescibacterota bacterium]|jgi:hypothetical protein
MKLTILCAFASFFFFGSVSAQENKGIIKKTVIKRVTVRDTVIETTVTSDVAEEKSVFQVEGNDQEEQQTTVVTKTNNTTEVVQNEVTSDAENKTKIAAIMAKKQTELDDSITAEKAKSAQEKLLLDQRKIELIEQMEVNRKKLEKRPKHMAKLIKDNGL